MKKLNYLILGLAGLTMASCSQDDLLDGVADGNYQVTINLPANMATRAIGDNAYAASLLNYAIFDMSGTFIEKGTASFPANSETMTLPLNLATGASFKIAFFAQSPESIDVYQFNASAEDHSVTVNYEEMASTLNNADGYDCFYEVLETGVIGSTTMKTQVTLNRIVAQINWGTSDYSEPSVTNTFGENLVNLDATLTVTVPNVFDLLTGATAGDPEEVEIGAFTPNNGTDAETFPLLGYQFVAMQYVLVPADKGLYNLDLQITNKAKSSDNTITINNAPIQANYRTNIYGTLLSDNVQFQVDLNPTWGTPAYEVDLTPWDGSTKTTPLVDTQKRTVTILKASDLAGFADMVSQGVGGNSYSGYTVTLAADFDMGGNTFAGLGSSNRLGSAPSGKSFSGQFDGQGHTISNFKIAQAPGTISLLGGVGAGAAGFIPNLSGSNASLTNVNFENVTIDAPENEQAGIVGLLSGGAKVSNVTVKSGSISAKGGAGGIVGRVLTSGSISDCNNYATITINGDASGGGIAGAAYYTANATSVNITNCNNYGAVIAEGSTTQTIGGIVGTSGANITGCHNYGPVGNNTTNGPAGGIAGYQNSCGSITNCVNEGKVMGSSQVGGIIAFIGGTEYTYKAPIYLTGNTNKGELVGAGNVGGILGINRNGCYMENNVNSAPSMTGGTVAGIVSNAMQSGSQANGYVYLVSGNVNNTPLDKMTGTKVQDIFTGTLYVGNDLQTNN